MLEIACGTGRVTTWLAETGVTIVGLDHSPEMLAIARAKSANPENVRWVEADMRAFELGKRFDLVIIPGHSFQNLNTPDDQAACLACIKRHLAPGGVLAVHLDHVGAENTPWLGDLCGELGGVFEEHPPFRHPRTGREIRTKHAWSYEPATQTAVSETIWAEVDESGQVLDRWETGPMPLHCVFRFEMEHLLARTGFTVGARYGNFFRGELQADSSNMIWLAR